MHSFTDNQDHKWSISLDTAKCREVKNELGVDLLAFDDSSMSKLMTDDAALVDVISFVCTEQIRRLDLDARGFAERIVGDVIDDACDALVDELIFISRRNKRAVVKAAWERTKATGNLQTERVTELLNSGVIEQAADREFEEMKTNLQQQLGR